jgi:uncharacterized RDD family membrane protein YckC
MTDPSNPSNSGSRLSLILAGSAVMIGLLAIGAFLALCRYTSAPELPRPLSGLQGVGIGDQLHLIGSRSASSTTPSQETGWLITTQEGRIQSESEINPFSYVVGFSDKLWFFSPGMYRIYDGKEWLRFDAPWVGEDPTVMALPGQLWLLSHNKGDLSLISYTGGVWDRPRPVPIDSRDRKFICTTHCPSGMVPYQGKISYYWLKDDELRQMSIDGVHPGRVESLGRMTAFSVLAESDRIYLWYLAPAESVEEGASPRKRLIGVKIYDAKGWHEGPPVERSARAGRLEIAALMFREKPHLLINRGFQIEDQIWDEGRPVRSEYLMGGDLGRAFLRYQELLLLQLVVTMTVGVAVLSFVLNQWKDSTAGSGVVYASVWRRFLAKAIDTTLILLPTGLLIVSSLEKEGSLMADPLGRFVSAGGVAMGIAWAILWIYHATTEGLLGQTLGKRICGIRVMDQDLKPCSPRQALVRNLLRPIDMLAFYWVGLVAISATRRWQRLGDRVGRTLVVQTKS